MWDDLKSLVGAVAPTLATALGGPLAGAATRAITGALGLNDAADAHEVMQQITADPEALLKLKKADQEFAVRMRELDIDVYKIDQQDRASARQREQNVGGYANPVLAAIVIGGFLAAVFFVLSGHVVTDTVNATLVGSVIGYVSAKADQVVSYYFGSSDGSRKKDGLLAKMKP